LFAVCFGEIAGRLMAGLDGIKYKIDPGQPVDKDQAFKVCNYFRVGDHSPESLSQLSPCEPG
jgi:glutamine synthetase